MLWSLTIFLSILMALMGIMFFTLLERKILSYSQNRLGPNKVSFTGLIQPLLDGVKLMINEKVITYKNNKIFYFMGPMLLILVMIFLWVILPSFFVIFSVKFSFLYFMVCLGLSVYSALISGWASNSKYSLLGSIRSMAQTISYELTLIFCILSLIFFLKSLNLSASNFLKFEFMMLISPLIMMWLINILAECNRTPFDFAEGESELVSGFNTEFSSSGFALLSVGEYGLIIFFSMLTVLLFFMMKYMYMLILLTMLNFFLLVRSSYPRFRYDFLMNLAWMKMLPLSIFYMGLIFMYSI